MPRLPALGIGHWARVHRFRGGRLVSLQRHRHGVRPGIPLAERLDRIVQRPLTRRALARTTLRLPTRGPGPPRGLADRLQHQQAAQRARLVHPGRARRGLASPTTAHTRIEVDQQSGSPHSVAHDLVTARCHNQATRAVTVHFVSALLVWELGVSTTSVFPHRMAVTRIRAVQSRWLRE